MNDRADVHSLTTDSGFDHARLQEHQRLNHFPRHVELTRKRVLCCPAALSGSMHWKPASLAFFVF